MMHITRWPNEQITIASEKSFITMERYTTLYPEILPYIMEYTFHEGDDSENLVLHCACINDVIPATKALFNDLGFHLVSTYDSEQGMKKKDEMLKLGMNQGHIDRERACLIMARVKGIEPKDASKVLDQEWDYIKTKKLKIADRL